LRPPMAHCRASEHARRIPWQILSQNETHPVKAFVLLAACCTAMPAICVAQTQNESFDLACAATASEAAAHRFHIEVDVDGAVTVSDKSETSSASHQARTYVNAYLWDADGVRHVVDRFTGMLSTKPAGTKWQCAKVGGRRF